MTKLITLKEDGRFEHLWLPSVHGQSIPESAIEVSDTVFMELSQNADSKKYDGDTDTVSDFSPAPPSLETRRLLAKSAIDLAAGNARQRYISVGKLIDLEYQQTEAETKAWRDNGSPANAVPADVQSWADAANMTPEEAATDIEQTASAWRQVLSTVRDIRLRGKAAVDTASDTGVADDMNIIAQPFIDQLDAMKP